jgi:hypothetical protein
MPRRDGNTPRNRTIHHAAMHSGAHGRGGDAKIRENKHKDSPPKKSKVKKTLRPPDMLE